MMLESVLISLGANALEEIPRQRRWRLQRAWRSAFARDWQDWSGPLLETDWHVFSYNYAKHWERAEAVAAFECVSLQPLMVAANLAEGPMFRCELRTLPDYVTLRNRWSGDLYLTNELVDWTFVLTHEASCGPYFAARQA
ncbi:MAG TPA: DUF4275 family protein [Polyangiales bacterium]